MMNNQNNYQPSFYAFNQGQLPNNNEYTNGEDDLGNYDINGEQYDPDSINQPDVSSFNFMLNSPDIVQNQQFLFPNNGFNH